MRGSEPESRDSIVTIEWPLCDMADSKLSLLQDKVSTMAELPCDYVALVISNNNL